MKILDQLDLDETAKIQVEALLQAVQAQAKNESAEHYQKVLQAKELKIQR